MDHRSEMILANIRAHAAQRGVSIEDVVSLKVRAVRDSRGEQTRYLGGNEYRDLVGAFLFRPSHGAYSGGQVFSAGNADLVEHESGPEIVAAVGAFGTAIDPYMTVVELASLVGGITLWLARKLRPSSSKATDGQSARYIRVEKREVAPDGTLKETIVSVIDATKPEDRRSLVKAIERAHTRNHGPGKRKKPRKACAD